MTDGTALRFSLAVSQNRYLSPDDRRMHAILHIRAEAPGDGSAADVGAPAAEVIIIDCSGSMDYPRTKIAAARRAAAAALDVLPDGVFFAVVQGTDRAATVYPDAAVGTCAMTARTRAEAKAAVARLYANGGTAIGSWLRHSRILLDRHPTAVRHAILLTDGHNQHETADELGAVLAGCAGHFVCDARGIGDDWRADELLRITSVLRGAASAVLVDSDLPAEFRAMTQAAMRKVVPDLRLRITTIRNARVSFVKQVHPTEADLAGDAGAITHPVAEFSTGTWGVEARDYHVCLDVGPAGQPDYGTEVRAARIDLLVDGQPQVEPGNILVLRTDDRRMSTQFAVDVQHYLDQEKYSQAVRAGCTAFRNGDRAAAQAGWSRAVGLAAAAGDPAALEHMKRLVDILDAAAGAVRIRPDLRLVDVEAAVLDSSYTTSPGRLDQADPGPPVTGPDRVCRCGRAAPPDAAFCPACGAPLRGSPAGPSGTEPAP
jgi:hypothetical protein